MRKSTLLWLVMATFSGTVLFHTSQKVHDEREKLAALDTSIGKEEESIRILNTEWSHLNQPERLESLSKTYLHMAPLRGSQFIKVEDIPLRTASPEETATTTPVVPVKVIPEKKIAESKPEEKKVAKSRVMMAATPKPAVKIYKPAAPAFLQKPVQHPAVSTSTTATNSRSFSDVMKNLRTGVE